MLQFASLGAFAAHLTHAIAPAVNSSMHSGLKAAAEQIEHTARAKLGHYQDSVEHFPAWPELADSTKADRVAKGFTENDPLLRTGALRDSIGHEVHGNEAVIGSKSDIAVYQELGTTKMPPRPFLGPAVVENEEALRALWHDVLLRGFLGRGVKSTTQMNGTRLRDGD
jgi:HK97 gp10 family phage protein